MERSWDQLTNELIREIAGDIEKDRQRPVRSENPTPGPSGLASPEKFGQGVEST